MEQNYLTNELKKTYKNLLKEIELLNEKLKKISIHVETPPQDIVHTINNPTTSISVITPAYNAGKFLPQLYQYLKNQSIASNTEWIIVDDCSNDNSMEFYIQLSSDKTLGKISVYRNNVNLGAAISLKRGWALATSNILAWVSADDYYVSENKLEKDLQLINSGFDLVFSQYTIFGSDLQTGKKISVPLKEYTDKHQMLADIMLWNYLNGSSVCIRKDVYLESGGINEFLVNVDGDFDLWSRNILLGKKIGFSNTITFIREHPNQTSKMIERMAVGKNITRLSYIRFLKNALVCEKFEKDFKNIINERYSNHYNLISNLTFMLSQNKLIRFSDINSIKNATSLLQNFILSSTWLEELSEKYRYTISMLKKTFKDLSSLHEIFKEKIYKLSDDLIKTKPFKVFAKKYK